MLCRLEDPSVNSSFIVAEEEGDDPSEVDRGHSAAEEQRPEESFQADAPATSTDSTFGLNFSPQQSYPSSLGDDQMSSAQSPSDRDDGPSSDRRRKRSNPPTLRHGVVAERGPGPADWPIGSRVMRLWESKSSSPFLVVGHEVRLFYSKFSLFHANSLALIVQFRNGVLHYRISPEGWNDKTYMIHLYAREDLVAFDPPGKRSRHRTFIP